MHCRQGYDTGPKPHKVLRNTAEILFRSRAKHDRATATQKHAQEGEEELETNNNNNNDNNDSSDESSSDDDDHENKNENDNDKNDDDRNDDNDNNDDDCDDDNDNNTSGMPTVSSSTPLLTFLTSSSATSSMTRTTLTAVHLCPL